MLDHFDGTESLCVSFERKNKPPVFTQDKSVLLNRMDEITATFKETLKVDATLYKDNKTGLYKVRALFIGCCISNSVKRKKWGSCLFCNESEA